MNIMPVKAQVNSSNVDFNGAIKIKGNKTAPKYLESIICDNSGLKSIADSGYDVLCKVKKKTLYFNGIYMNEAYRIGVKVLPEKISLLSIIKRLSPFKYLSKNYHRDGYWINKFDNITENNVKSFVKVTD